MSDIIIDHECDEGKTCYEIPSCIKNVCKAFDVSLPVSITPFAVADTPEIICAGEIEITQGNLCCDDEGEENEKRFKFTISQQIEVEIPVKFGAEVCYHESCAEENDDCGEMEE
jgi:hypothetical protein